MVRSVFLFALLLLSGCVTTEINAKAPITVTNSPDNTILPPGAALATAEPARIYNIFPSESGLEYGICNPEHGSVHKAVTAGIGSDDSLLLDYDEPCNEPNLSDDPHYVEGQYCWHGGRLRRAVCKKWIPVGEAECDGKKQIIMVDGVPKRLLCRGSYEIEVVNQK